MGYYYNLDTKKYQKEEYLYDLLADYSTDGYYLMDITPKIGEQYVKD